MTRTVDARLVGQSFDLRLDFTSDGDLLRARFEELYRELYGITGLRGAIEIVNVRLRVTLPRRTQPRLIPPWPEPTRSIDSRAIWFGSSLGVTGMKSITARVAWRPGLPVGTEIIGPAVLEQYDSTTLVPPGWTARVDECFNLVLAGTRS